MATERDAHYWVGSLAMTVACASKAPDPGPILRPAIRRFLHDHPPGNELGDYLRATLKEKT
jgi:hypothetical protein